MKILKENWKVILIIILGIALAYFIKKNNQMKDDIVASKILLDQAKTIQSNLSEEPKQPPVKEIEKPGGGTLVKQQVIVASNQIPQEVQNALRKSYLQDTIIAALRKENSGKDIALKSVTRLLGEANKKLEAKDLINTAENDKNGILEWETPYYYSRVDIAAKTNETKYNNKIDFLQITETGKGFLGTGLFRKKEDFLVGTSPDPSATFYGMIQSRTPIKERKDLFNLSLEAGGRYFLKPYNQLSLFSGIRVTINPDGKWQPSISGQYMIDPLTGAVRPIVEARINYTIFE